VCIWVNNVYNCWNNCCFRIGIERYINIKDILLSMKRCKLCGASENRVSIYSETGLCMDCQTDWNIEQSEIEKEENIKKAKKEKDFYKF